MILLQSSSNSQIRQPKSLCRTRPSFLRVNPSNPSVCANKTQETFSDLILPKMVPTPVEPVTTTKIREIPTIAKKLTKPSAKFWVYSHLPTDRTFPPLISNPKKMNCAHTNDPKCSTRLNHAKYQSFECEQSCLSHSSLLTLAINQSRPLMTTIFVRIWS